MAKIFTKLFLGDVVYTVGSKVFRKLTTESGGLPIWNGTDLTGTTWNVPSGWVTERNQAAYIADYTAIVDGATYTGNFIGLGYRGNGIYRANEIALCVNDEYVVNAMLNNSTQFTITITGGTDATNTGLISWLKANGELTSHQTPTTNLITFTINGTTYQAEEGMTWAEWLDTNYNTNGFTQNLLDGTITVFIRSSGTIRGYGVAYDGSFVSIEDTIVADRAYTEKLGTHM